MKKYIVILIFLITNLASYGAYFSLTEKNTNNILYGKIKTKDFISGNVYIQDIYAKTFCSGFFFGITPDTAKTLKTGAGFAKVKCNNGKLMEVNLQSPTSGDAIDQYNNLYTFKQIKRKEYKKNIKQKAKLNEIDKI